ncbi:MAG: ogt 1 [Myxococcales bacterium]|nr:ogt 1 [Myxococcales bacterium]
MKRNACFYSELDSPIGPLLLVGDGTALTGLTMGEHKHMPPLPDGCRRDDDVFREARAQLRDYFAGTRTTFDLAVRAEGTPFQQRVWLGLRAIPFGETESYGALAKRLGDANASRAVGMANGRNPISIIVPCHRVVGANGTLTGYGGGLERKQWLLEHERRPRAD